MIQKTLIHNPNGFQSILGRPLRCRIGRDIASCEDVSLEFAESLTHTLVLGMSGTGKTKVMQRHIRDAVKAYIPIVLIDLEGDFAEDTFADIISLAIESGSDAILERNSLCSTGLATDLWTRSVRLRGNPERSNRHGGLGGQPGTNDRVVCDSGSG